MLVLHLTEVDRCLVNRRRPEYADDDKAKKLKKSVFFASFTLLLAEFLIRLPTDAVMVWVLSAAMLMWCWLFYVALLDILSRLPTWPETFQLFFLPLYLLWSRDYFIFSLILHHLHSLIWTLPSSWNYFRCISLACSVLCFLYFI